MSSSGLAIGQTFSHYRLLDKLGEGGMGIVYLAEDTVLRRQVAVKFLSLERNRPMFHSRFLREAQAASKLNHPNIAAVYDYGKTEDEQPFIVMELLRGQTLAELLQTGTLTIRQSIEIITKVLEALEDAHAHGIIHRDIKPSNISVSDRGAVKVLDFGLAKSLLDEVSDTEAVATDLPTQTLTGVVLGTPLYVSPEQATGAPVDARSDVFSVGAVLYECIAKHAAFAAPSVVEIFAQVVSNVPPPAPSHYNKAASTEIDRIVLKALSRSLEDRYQSVTEFLDDIDRLNSELTPVPKPHRVLGSSLDALYRKIVSRSHVRPASQQRVVARTVTSSEPSHHKRSWIGTLAYSSVIVILVALFLGVWTYRVERPAEPIDSIAILPFINESKDEKGDYLADGLSDTLISHLSQLKNLKVISRNSVARYKEPEIDPVKIGSELKVAAVLVGRIKMLGDMATIVVELISTREGALIWKRQFEQRAGMLFTVSEEIAQKIQQSRLNTDTGEVRFVSGKRPVDPAAYDLYVKGRWYWNKFTWDAGKQAIQCFQQAIDIDPNFALAYAGLADTYVLNTWVPAEEAYLRATAAAKRALELDETIGEAHATFGFIKSHYDRDWSGAELEFKRAIELTPGYATAHHWYAAQLLAEGRFDKALVEINVARELDPLSPIINTEVGLVYFYQRQYDSAIEHFKKVGVLFPNFFPTHYYLGWCYTHKGMYAEAIAEFEKALALSNRHSLVLASLGYTQAVAGRTDEARAVIRELDEIATHKNVTPFRYALVNTGLGEKDLAFKWLNRAFDERDITMIHVNVSPFFDSLREDPRFTDLVHRMGLGTRAAITTR